MHKVSFAQALVMLLCNALRIVFSAILIAVLLIIVNRDRPVAGLCKGSCANTKRAAKNRPIGNDGAAMQLFMSNF